MRNLLFVTALVAASNGVVAGEVGAPYPQLAGSAATSIAAAIAETGASTRWATTPSHSTEKMVNKELQMHVNKLNSKLADKINAAVEKNIEASLAQ